jgi:hypothetical protein
MGELKVGGDVEAYCTTCRTMKDHVIVAMVEGRPAKVECAGCHKQHAFRAGPPGARAEPSRRATPASRSAAPALAPLTADLESKLAARAPRPYAPAERYALDDVIAHPSFGVGVVTSLPGAQKVEVTFRGGARKLLLHDRGAAQAPALERPRPREEDGAVAVTDAPPPK